MTIERSHGKARPTLPRASDLAELKPEPKRTEGRDASGRFTSANPWAGGSKWRSLISDGLGRELEGEAGVLGKRAYRLFRTFLADLPSDGPTVRSLVAQRARAVALADRYAARAALLDLDSDEGAKAAGEALKWDQRAERLAVTSLDVAAKMAGKRKVIDAHAEVARVFGGER